MNVLCLVPTSLGKDKLHIVTYRIISWREIISFVHGKRENKKKSLSWLPYFKAGVNLLVKDNTKIERRKKILPYYFDTFLLYIFSKLSKSFHSHHNPITIEVTLAMASHFNNWISFSLMFLIKTS